MQNLQEFHFLLLDMDVKRQASPTRCRRLYSVRSVSASHHLRIPQID